MNARNSIIAVGGFLAFAAGFGWVCLQSARRAEAALAASSEELGRLEASLQQARTRIDGREQDAVTLRAKLGRASADGIATPAPAASNPPRPKDKDPATLMASDPSLRALYLKSFRTDLILRYGWLYHSLGLSQEQIDRFEALATEQEDDSVAIQAAAIAQGLPPSDAGLAALRQQSQEQFYATVEEEVSPELSRQMIQLDRIEPARLLTSVSSLFIPPGAPELTDLQQAQLSQIVANASASYQAGGEADVSTVNWDQVYGQAAAIISGPQLQGFKASMDLQQYRKVRNQLQAQQAGGQ